MSSQIELVSDTGSGRVFLVLEEGAEGYRPLCDAVVQNLSQRTRVLHLRTARVTPESAEVVTEELRQLLTAHAVRQLSIIGFGGAGAVAQLLTLRSLKMVRSLILIDAETRAHPTEWQLLIERIEQSLPLGLPLRLGDVGFDSKPWLQRIRCPTLAIVTARATKHQLAEWQVLQQRLPSAWGYSLQGSADPAAKIAELVVSFQEVPAKCPQEGLARQ